MNFKFVSSSSAMVLALAACGGGSSAPTGPVINSVGLLELALPEGDDLAAFEQPFLQERADAIRAINESVTEAADPIGSAEYSGSFYIGIDDAFPSIATGSVLLTVNPSSSSISGEYTLFSIYRPGEFSEHVSITLTMPSTAINSGRYEGTISGSGTYDGGGVSTTAAFDGTVTGAFADSLTTIGSMQGTATSDDETVDFYGVYDAALPPPP